VPGAPPAKPKRARTAARYFCVEQYKLRRARGGLSLATFPELQAGLLAAFHALPEARKAPYLARAAADAARYAEEITAWRALRPPKKKQQKRKRRAVISDDEESAEDESAEEEDEEPWKAADVSDDEVAAEAVEAEAPALTRSERAVRREATVLHTTLERRDAPAPPAPWVRRDALAPPLGHREAAPPPAAAAGSLMRLREGAQTPAAARVPRAPTPMAPLPAHRERPVAQAKQMRVSRGLGSTPRVNPSATPAHAGAYERKPAQPRRLPVGTPRPRRK